ncbi:MAG: RES family NAD+ phosphorylase [Candidatus Marinimicrobia bacterium]|nr:RES family NAD+ phosphorylase [Candidatus Neomarinimicrobiota bacterium]MCH8069092.1 RES family NAD+ phosphorylase [Candidatus Neomarinimicrobiota bacterium]
MFIWDGTSYGSAIMQNLFPPRSRQGSGRHDIPDRTAVIYCSKSPVSAVAEVIQGFRGTFLTNRVFLYPGNKVRALAHILLDDSVLLVDLDDPEELSKRQLNPSQVATMNRQMTQSISRSMFDEGAFGFTWWSTLDASWTNATLFENRISEYLSIEDQVLVLEKQMSVVINASKALNIQIR